MRSLIVVPFRSVLCLRRFVRGLALAGGCAVLGTLVVVAQREERLLLECQRMRELRKRLKNRFQTLLKRLVGRSAVSLTGEMSLRASDWTQRRWPGRSTAPSEPVDQPC